MNANIVNLVGKVAVELGLMVGADPGSVLGVVQKHENIVSEQWGESPYFLAHLVLVAEQDQLGYGPGELGAVIPVEPSPQAKWNKFVATFDAAVAQGYPETTPAIVQEYAAAHKKPVPQESKPTA